MIFLYAFLAQLIVAGIVIAILKLLLDDMLLDLALRQFEYWLGTEGREVKAREIAVVCYKPLKPKHLERLQKAVSRNWGNEVKPVFHEDRKLLGGIIIRAGERKFDCSLKDRLQQAFARR